MTALGADAVDGSASFSIGAIGMIGLPPTAGFVTKIYLGVGALQSGAAWALGVLVVSTLLNAAYFLPLIYRIWFLEARSETQVIEGPLALIGPAVVTALVSIAVGVMAGAAFSPLGWATLIAQQEYLP